MTVPARQQRQLADPNRDGTLFVRHLHLGLELPRLPGLTLRAATLADAVRLSQAMHDSGDYPDDVVMARLPDGRFPYVIETDGGDGVIVCYGWVALSGEHTGDSGLAFRLKDGDAYIYDCATLPDHRGHGYYPALLQLMAAELGRGGWQRVWIGTAPGNFVSQRGILRAGFTKVGDMQLAHRPDGSFRIDLYGTPGADALTVADGAWTFYARAHPEAGIAT